MEKHKIEIKRSFPLRLVMTHSIKETLSRKCYFALAFLSCFLVSLVALVANSVVSQGPIIFLLVAENNVGEQDYVVTALPTKVSSSEISLDKYFYRFINYTQIISNSVDQVPEIELLSSPRILRPAKIKECKSCADSDATIYFIDTEKEKNMKLGRAYSTDSNHMSSSDECVIHQNLVANFRKKDKALVTFKYDQFLKNIIVSNFESELSKNETLYTSIDSSNSTIYDVSFECKIINILSEPFGKLGDSSDSFVFMEYKYLGNLLSKKINSTLIDSFPGLPAIINNLNMYHYADSTLVNFPNDRIKRYLVSSFDDLKLDAALFFNQLGVKGEGLSVSLPLVTEMQPLYYGAIFLGLILNLIIIILFGLSILLIYSLLLVTTETSTYDLGIIRLIGSTKKTIVSLLVTQCLLFSVPAFIVSFFLHFLILKGVGRVLSKLSSSDSEIAVSGNAILYAFIICNLCPILASIQPIYNLTNKSLSESLSSLGKTSGVKIEVISLVNRERSTLIIFGILTCIYGISIYYLLPLSLLSMNLYLLLTIFLWILIGMLIGFVLLVSNLELIVQKLLTYALLFWSKSFIKQVLLKNFISHRIRNQSTNRMFSLSVGVLILLIVSMNIEFTSNFLNISKKIGSNVSMTPAGKTYFTATALKNLIDTLKNNSLISEFTYITPTVNNLCCDTIYENEGKAFTFSLNTVAIGPNFHRAADETFLKVVKEHLKIEGSVPSEHLYVLQNKGRMGQSTFFTDQINLAINDTYYLTITSPDSKEYLNFLFKTSFILSSNPGIEMAGSEVSARKRSALISYPMFSEMLLKISSFFYVETTILDTFSTTQNKIENIPFSIRYNSIPINNVLMKTPDSTADTFNKIYDIIDKDPTINASVLSDVKSVNVIARTQSFIKIIFYFFSLIILIYCFFNLSATMIINIYEQQKEIAVLRALGMTSRSINLIYVAEAVIIIISASLVGLIIGTIIAWTMLIQRVLFTNLPLRFNFPYLEMFFILILGIFGGFASSFFSIRKVSRKQINSLMKS